MVDAGYHWDNEQVFSAQCAWVHFGFGGYEMPKTLCPNCEDSLNFSNVPRIGQKITCPHCGEILEVLGLEPIKLDLVYEESDDDYEDYESEDDN
jgi:lysine biosynthesis protein LysW